VCVYCVPIYVYSSCGSIYVFTISILYLGYIPTCAFACVLHLNRIVRAFVRLGDGTGYLIKIPVYRIPGVCVCVCAQVYYRLYISIYTYYTLPSRNAKTSRRNVSSFRRKRCVIYYKL